MEECCESKPYQQWEKVTGILLWKLNEHLNKVQRITQTKLSKVIKLN